MATETYELGCTPSGEDCAQVGSDDYHKRARAECNAYRNQLYRLLESKGHAKDTLPGNFRLTIKGFQHDFGTYHEVVAKFDADNGAAWELVTLLDNEAPEYWDEIAKQEIAESLKNND